MCTVIQGLNGKQTVYNIHNYGFSRSELSLVCKTIVKSNEDAAANPLFNNILILGDMNISANPAEFSITEIPSEPWVCACQLGTCIVKEELWVTHWRSISKWSPERPLDTTRRLTAV
jgi:hypothetical protein